MKTLLILSVLFTGSIAHADSWTVDGKSFSTKAEAVRAVLTSSNPNPKIVQTQCVVLTKKLSFKKCPKADE